MAKKKESAAEYGMRLLAASSKTREQLKKKMEEKGFDSAEIEKILDYFKDRNFINDYEYALKKVEKYMKTSFFSKNLIREKLLENGIAPDMIDKTLVNVSDRETALSALRDKFKPVKIRESAIKLRQKAAIYLQTKGFDYDIIEEIVESEIKGGNEFEQ